MKALFHKLKTRWALIAVLVLIAAFVAGVNYGIRTSGGAVAEERTPRPTPPFLVNTPTDAEFEASIATAVAKGDPGFYDLTIEVIDPKTGRPVEDSVSGQQDPQLAELEAAYNAADAAYSSFWSHVWNDQLTPSYREYLNTDPGRAIYLVEVDRVIHLPRGVELYWIDDLDTIPYPACISCPAYGLRTGEETVRIDSDGRVFVRNSDVLPDGFSFLSEFEIVHWKR